MSALTEVEAAADALTAREKRELFLFLAGRLRGNEESETVSGPRRFSPERMADWIDRDEADLRRFRGEG